MQAISKLEGRISCIPTTRRSISLSPWANCDSSTAHSFCRPLLTSLLRQTSLERFRSLRGMPAKERRELLMRQGVYSYEYMDSWERFAEPSFPPRKPYSASFQTSTSAMRSTGMHNASGRFSTATPWGTTTISTTAATSYCWRMSSRHFGRPA